MALKLHWAYMDGDWAVGDYATPEEAVAARAEDVGQAPWQRIRLSAWQVRGDGEQQRASGEIDVEIQEDTLIAPREGRQYPEGAAP